MDWSAFRHYAHTVVDDVCDYYLSLEERNVQSEVKPGYLKQHIPTEAPVLGEPFEAIRNDVFKHIMPGITHWQHPSFFAFYPSNSSPAAFLGEMYSNMFNCIGFNWSCSPAYTELETIVLDWLAQALRLDAGFLSYGKGCGIIQGSASEALLTALLGARKISLDNGNGIDKLVFYCSDQTHSCGVKASKIALMQTRIIKTNDKGQMMAEALQLAVIQDIESGLVPCFCVGTFGSTTSGIVDDLVNIGSICKKYKIWYHIDAAYAGAFLIDSNFQCPTDLADSFNMNTHKMMLTNFDCSPLWVKDRSKLVDALSISAPYFRNRASEQGFVTDFRDLQIPLGRRFRSLKLWFVMRIYGTEGIQAHLNKHLEFARYIRQKVEKEDRLVVHDFNFGLVSFSCKAGSESTRNLYNLIIKENTYLSMSQVHGKEVIRFVSGSLQTEKSHVKEFWKILELSLNKLD
eukprot:NODE_720_length_4814_cov_0.354613.p1 type:complete len:459 gc:universal NODE_720_length_4814_cov_0.354613:3295-4671(+)